MTTQRWGTFSVNDHTVPLPFAVDVLLYDKLVLPRAATGLKRADWDHKEWDPERLDKVLEVLGDDKNGGKAIVVDWTDDSTQMALQSNLSAADEIGREACKYDITRRFLQQHTIDGLDEDEKVEVLAAYRNPQRIENDWQDNTAQPTSEILTAALAHQLLVPDPSGKSWQQALAEGIALSNDLDFKRKRNRMYDWQRLVIGSGFSQDEAVQAMADYVNEYNEAVKRNVDKVYKKFAFTLVPIIASAYIGNFGAAAATTAVASLLQFYIFDRSPVVPAEVNHAAAMFHTAQERLSWMPRQ